MDKHDEALMQEIVPAENIAVFKKKLMNTLSRVDELLDSIKGQCAEVIPPKWEREINSIVSFIVRNADISKISYASLDTYIDTISVDDKPKYCKFILDKLHSVEGEEFMKKYCIFKRITI